MLTVKSEHYRKTFENMQSEHLRLWLHLAQNELPSKVGAAREIIKAGISAAASELLFRWRHNL